MLFFLLTSVPLCRLALVQRVPSELLLVDALRVSLVWQSTLTFRVSKVSDFGVLFRHAIRFRPDEIPGDTIPTAGIFFDTFKNGDVSFMHMTKHVVPAYALRAKKETNTAFRSL